MLGFWGKFKREVAEAGFCMRAEFLGARGGTLHTLEKAAVWNIVLSEATLSFFRADYQFDFLG